jgi:hypothetical protein
VTLPVAPTTTEPAEPGAEGNVSVDLLDEHGAVLGPVPASDLSRCHHRSSPNIGWALYRKTERQEFELHESEGISKTALSCVKRSLATVSSWGAGPKPLVVYVRLR